VSPPVAAAREEGRVPRHLQQPADPRLAEILDIVVDAGEAELQPRYEVRCEADLEPRDDVLVVRHVTVEVVGLRDLPPERVDLDIGDPGTEGPHARERVRAAGRRA